MEMELEIIEKEIIEIELVEKFNPYHDPKNGRFTDGKGMSTFSANPNTSAGKKAIEREENRQKTASTGGANGKKTVENKKVAENKKATAKEKEDAVFDYTTSRYEKINSSLRTGKGLSAKDKKTVEIMDEAINESTIKSGTTLYRGTSFDALGLSKNAKLSDLKKLEGQTITDKAFMSTSTSKKSADNFTGRGENGGNVRFIINVKGDKKGLDVGKNSNFGDKEHEVILPRDAKLTVTKVKRVSRASNSGFGSIQYTEVYVDY